MLIDARSLPQPLDETIHADLCVVGAGPAGMTIAMELAGAGIHICVVESGGEAPTNSDQRLARGENADPFYYRLDRTRIRSFAGTSNHWDPRGMIARPLDPLDFEDRPEVGRWGWPFDRAHLDPYYQRAQAIIKLGPCEYDVAAWGEGERTRRLDLGNDVLTTMYQRAEVGNFQRYRSSLARLHDVQVLLHATALELVTNEAGDHVDHLEVTLGGGRRCRVTAREFILAAGAIENARLLLLSRLTHRRGLGNRHDLVGRYFMEHPHAPSGVLHPSHDSVTARIAPYELRVLHGTKVWWALTIGEQALRRERILGSAWALRLATAPLVSDTARALLDCKKTLTSYRRPVPGTGRRVRAVAGHPLDVARILRSAWARRTGNTAPTRALLTFSAEQNPNPASRVTLGRRRDHNGQPQARLDWRLTDLDHRSIRVAQEMIDRAFRGSGLGWMSSRFGEENPPVALGGGFHHMGTTRMHQDPAQGVVNADGRVHGLDNLFVTGSSVFPSSGFANPTLTVVALAIRLAEHVRAILDRHA